MTLSSQVKLYTTLHKIDVSQNWAYKHRSIQHGVTEHTQVLLVCQGFQLVKGPSLLELQVGYARQCPWNLCPYFYPPNMTVRSLLYLRKIGLIFKTLRGNQIWPETLHLALWFTNTVTIYAHMQKYIYTYYIDAIVDGNFHSPQQLQLKGGGSSQPCLMMPLLRESSHLVTGS